MNDRHALTWYNTWKQFPPLNESMQIMMELRVRNLQLIGNNDNTIGMLRRNENFTTFQEEIEDENNVKGVRAEKSFFKRICNIM